MSVALLDVNVLVALAWPTHIYHHAAHRWFEQNHSKGWATCPLTQCGFVRVSSNSNIIREAVEPMEALALLRQIVTLNGHTFWPDALPLVDESVPTDLLAGHRQITDAYLLGLAIHNQGRLATLDRGVAALLSETSPFKSALEFIPVEIL
ncbi:MAG: hypothetical protein KJ060_17730 [Candidatus Hydrogenedentes bacterium]|nr:hypothetical protein [Candidatus Hydrogenedentota bacterium]